MTAFELKLLRGLRDQLSKDELYVNMLINYATAPSPSIKKWLADNANIISPAMSINIKHLIPTYVQQQTNEETATTGTH